MFHCHVCFPGGRNSIQNQPTSKNSNSTSRQHFRFSNHWVFDDLQPPSVFIGTSSTRLPPHHPYTAAFMWVPKMTIDAVLDKTRSVDVCHTANGGLIPCSPVEHSFALLAVYHMIFVVIICRQIISPDVVLGGNDVNKSTKTSHVVYVYIYYAILYHTSV